MSDDAPWIDPELIAAGQLLKSHGPAALNPASSPNTCLSCAIVSGRRKTVGGLIARTSKFHAHQDVAYPVPGLVIVAALRHFIRLDEMDPVETAELLPLLQRLRRAQTRVLGTQHTYYFYNEDTRHHFHVWMVPRHEWMREFGKSVESVRPALRHAAATMSDPTSIAHLANMSDALREAMIAEERTV